MDKNNYEEIEIDYTDSEIHAQNKKKSEKNKKNLKHYKEEIQSIDNIFTNQLLRYKFSFKILVTVFILSILLSLGTAFYMYNLLSAAIDQINKRPYLVLSDTIYTQSKANINLEKYIQNNLYNITRNLFNINPKNPNKNMEYIISFTTKKKVIEGYRNWLQEKVTFLNTVEGIMFFIPEDFKYQIEEDRINEKGQLVYVGEIIGDLVTLSDIRPTKNKYRIQMRIIINSSHVGMNQSGIDIVGLVINQVGK